MNVGFDYKTRIYDKMISRVLRTAGGVLIEGPKWCGKTASALKAAQSVVFLQDPDNAEHYAGVIASQPSLLLHGEPPLLLDEWQMFPVLWDAVRFAIDKRGTTGQFLLTGSAVPTDHATAHSGTGRIARVRMRPMSLFESGESNGQVSLAALFSHADTAVEGRSALSVAEIAYLLCRGGWPATLTMGHDDALGVAYNYLDMVVNGDVSRVDGIEKNPERTRLLLQSLARNITTLATNKTILQDVTSNDIGMSDRTLDSYMNVLQRIFVVEDMPAWAPAIRSKTAIRTAKKRHFVDPSIAAAALRLTPEALLQDFVAFGYMFESLCARDVRVYAQACDGDVLHYRDRTGLEADMIVRLHDGRWAAIEVKLGSRQVDEAAANLLRLKQKAEEASILSPSFLMVLTGGEFAYRRPDGVCVVPLGCLKD